MEKRIALAMLTIIATILVALGCIYAPVPATARASFCGPGSYQDGFNEVAAVFSGRVLNITQVQHNSGSYSFTEDSVQFEVMSTWKGVSEPQITLTTGPSNSPDCGTGYCQYNFAVGTSYLVYARRWEEKPTINLGTWSFTLPFGTISSL